MKISKECQSISTAAAALSSVAAVTLVALAALKVLSPMRGYLPAGGCALLSASFIKLACQSVKEQQEDTPAPPAGPPADQPPAGPPAPPAAPALPQEIRGGATIEEMNFIDHLSDPEIDIDYLRGLIQSATFNPNRVFTNGRHTANQETAFIAWVKSERFPELIADFKAKGVNPNICDGFGNTALHWACQNGRYKLALAIMSLPEVDIELETTYSNNSANFTRNALAIVLAQGFVRGNSTTWNFTGTPYQEVVRKMIALKPELRNIQIDGLYPVELALCHRDLEMVKLLDTPEVDHQKLEEILARDYAGTRPILYRVFTVDTVVEKAANRLSVKNWLHSKAPNWFDSDPWTQKKGAIQNYLANERAGVLQQRQPEA